MQMTVIEHWTANQRYHLKLYHVEVVTHYCEAEHFRVMQMTVIEHWTANQRYHLKLYHAEVVTHFREAEHFCVTQMIVKMYWAASQLYHLKHYHAEIVTRVLEIRQCSLLEHDLQNDLYHKNPTLDGVKGQSKNQ
jgi:hypothetical protein